MYQGLCSVQWLSVSVICTVWLGEGNQDVQRLPKTGIQQLLSVAYNLPQTENVEFCILQWYYRIFRYIVAGNRAQSTSLRAFPGTQWFLHNSEKKKVYEPAEDEIGRDSQVPNFRWMWVCVTCRRWLKEMHAQNFIRM